MLFEKCTTPVKAIAWSIGKKMAKTGVRMVPRPKPEKKVRMAVTNAVTVIITKSNSCYSIKVQNYSPIVKLTLRLELLEIE